MRPLKLTPLDDTNRKLLLALMEDGRRTHVDLSNLLRISRPTVIDRCRRMEDEGVIDGYSARVRPAVFGKPTLAFVAVTYRQDMDLEEEARFLDALAAIPDVLEAYSVSGDDCLLVKVCAADANGIGDVLRQIRALGEKITTRTTFVLEAHFIKPGPGSRPYQQPRKIRWNAPDGEKP